jgi:low affinity Fe/Cu permease
MNDLFNRFARWSADLTGSAWAFLLSFVAVVVWAALGPAFGFSDTWQLVINTATTVLTFLIVFLIQNTQNRDSRAMHLKIDELIRTNSKARNTMIDLEKLTDDQLARLQKEFDKLCSENRTEGGEPVEEISEQIGRAAHSRRDRSSSRGDGRQEDGSKVS